MPVPEHLRRPLSLRTLATQYWDLSAIPRTRSFELLAIGCTNELEREKLIEFTTAEGQQDLFTYANRPRRTILEVLADFRHSTALLTLPILFELFEPIKTRSFSIASCKQSGSLDLLVAVVEYKTNLKTARKGLCSSWLKGLMRGDQLRAVVKRGTFNVPSDSATPLIMCGPGTGLAPFRSILQAAKCNGDRQADKQVLFFGCRNETGDFHCGHELRGMQDDGLLTLHTAFSRDQQDKCYVQHVIGQQKALLRALLVEQKGVFLLAGNSKNMPQAVREAVQEAVGQPHLDEMIKTGRYQEETWA